MNTTIESVLYRSKTLSNGEHPLMLRLTKNRKLKYISLHISLNAEYLNPIWAMMFIKISFY
jgi:hypothetical protein